MADTKPCRRVVTKRTATLVGVVALSFALSACQPVPDDATLAELGMTRGRRIGTAVEPSHVADPDIATFLADEFSIVAVENVMKFGPIHPERDRYDFAPADAIVDAAAANGQHVRGHTLVWHRQNPAWLVGGTWTRDEAISVLEDHITTVVTHFRGRVDQWDVVNEAVDDTGALRDTFWLRTIGPEYVAMAFEFARAADPDVALYYNDYLIERAGAKADRVERLVDDLMAAGVPIDGVGFQMHVLVPELMPSPNALRREFERYASRGLRVAITEMDVAHILPSTPEKFAAQADAYDNAIMACLAVRACDTIVFWGWSDAESWIDAEFPGFGNALLFDRAGQPKVAYERIRGVLWWNLQPPPE